MEKNKESQANTLNELQTEIKSLKSLLLNRRAPGAGPAAVSPASSPLPWNSGSYAGAASSAASSTSPVAAAPSSPSVSTPKSDDAAMNFLNTKASIPAWQLAAQKATVAAPETPADPETTA